MLVGKLRVNAEEMVLGAVGSLLGVELLSGRSVKGRGAERGTCVTLGLDRQGCMRLTRKSLPGFRFRRRSSRGSSLKYPMRGRFLRRLLTVKGKNSEGSREYSRYSFEESLRLFGRSPGLKREKLRKSPPKLTFWRTFSEKIGLP